MVSHHKISANALLLIAVSIPIVSLALSHTLPDCSAIMNYS